MMRACDILDNLKKAIPRLTGYRARCPQQDCLILDETFSLPGAIIHLNDVHQWSREQIADWLETLDVDLRFNPQESEGEVNE